MLFFGLSTGATWWWTHRDWHHLTPDERQAIARAVGNGVAPSDPALSEYVIGEARRVRKQVGGQRFIWVMRAALTWIAVEAVVAFANRDPLEGVAHAVLLVAVGPFLPRYPSWSQRRISAAEEAARAAQGSN